MQKTHVTLRGQRYIATPLARINGSWLVLVVWMVVEAIRWSRGFWLPFTIAAGLLIAKGVVAVSRRRRARTKPS